MRRDLIAAAATWGAIITRDRIADAGVGFAVVVAMNIVGAAGFVEKDEEEGAQGGDAGGDDDDVGFDAERQVSMLGRLFWRTGNDSLRVPNPKCHCDICLCVEHSAGLLWVRELTSDVRARG